MLAILIAAAAVAAGTPTGTVTPVDAVTGDIVSYILSYGVLGVVSLALAFRFLVPRSAVTEARQQARADLLEERTRILEEKAKAERERDEALRVARDLAPMLVSFTSATQSLLPLLQDLVSRREHRRDR